MGSPGNCIIPYYVVVPYLSGATLTDIMTGNNGKPACIHRMKKKV